MTIRFSGHVSATDLFNLILIFTLFLLFAASGTAQTKLSYVVQYSNEQSNRIHVRIVVPGGNKSPLTFVMPRAIPSGYAQQPYDRFVENVSATSPEGATLKVEKESGPRWRVTDSNLVKIEYDVDLLRLEREILDASAASKARPEYVGLLGYSVLGYLEGFENLPVRLEVNAPRGWPVFTTLAPKVPADISQTITEAKNFYELADSQIAMGPKLELRRLRTDLPLFLAIYAEVPTDITKHGQIF